MNLSSLTLDKQVKLQYWLDVIRQCSAFGLTNQIWCEQHHISLKSYYYWLSKIWSYVKKKYKLNVTNFLCSERSLTCYFYCILLDVFKILFLIFIWRQISTMTVNAYGIIKCFDVFKNQFMCMCIIKDFKPVDPFSLQKCMERFYTGVIPWICFL